jgi:PST family polysaccharide transporter
VRVLQPGLSRLQDEPKRFAEASISALYLLTWASFPLSAGLALLAEETIQLVFGDQWLAVVPVYRVLCIAGLLQTLLNVSGTFFVTRGKAREFFQFGIFSSCFTVLGFVLGFVPCIWYGGIGAAIGYSVVVYCMAPILYAVLERVVGLPLRGVARTVIGQSAGSQGFNCQTTALIRPVAIAGPLIGRVASLAIAGALTYAALTPLLARQALRELSRAWKQARG